MKKVLFICEVNVARSQMAEAFFNKFTNTRNGKSAGVDPLTPQRYIHPVEEVIQIMSEEGLDLSQSKVKTVNQEMVDDVDEIVVLCEKEKLPEFVTNSSKKVIYKPVTDPFGESLESFIKVKYHLREIVLELIKR